MAHRKAFTIAMIRHLRRLGPLARRKRIPRQQQPDTIRLEYYKAILPVVHAAIGRFSGYRAEVLSLLRAHLEATGRMDSPPEDDAKRLLKRAQREADNDISTKRLENTARRYAERVSDFQREQLDKQTRAAFGIPLAIIEPHVTVKLEEFAARNAELIKSVSDRYYDRIRLDVEDAFAKGRRPEDLAEDFQERFDMAERDAMRIARDQIGRLNAELNEERMKGLGITTAIWRTANDERVRDEHAALEGQEFELSMGIGGIWPGSEIQCRCYAEPVFDGIIGAVDE